MIDDAGHALFSRLAQAAERCVLTTHVQPDGDALGSQLSLARFLVSRGKQVRIVNGDATAPNLRFIEEASLPVEVYDAALHDPVLAGADLVILLDNSAPDRLGRMEPVMRSLAARTLCIDHHPARDMPWAHPIIDETTCATAVLVYELTRGCGWTPDPRAAEALYVGLATDTGFFRFNSTNAAAHEVAAALLRLGVRPARAYQAIFERNSLAFTRLLGHVLVAVQLDAGGAVASVRIPRELVLRVAGEDVDTSEMTTPLLAMAGVQVALLFRELAGARVKVSLRSKGGLDVHRLATEFGGGGHRNASGIVTSGELDQVADAVLERVTAFLAAAPPPPA